MEPLLAKGAKLDPADEVGGRVWLRGKGKDPA
jgi:hypothetical protein